ncbi:Potassium transporter 5 [Ananas comosus]|uniref:Potassium transporter 5 n=1 Tax=Ananas comosus TaxID=4615 RepID=A0A199VMR7_ANACO|nr:Potassium transporter 5 [Ananas comosus]
MSGADHASLREHAGRGFLSGLAVLFELEDLRECDRLNELPSPISRSPFESYSPAKEIKASKKYNFLSFVVLPSVSLAYIGQAACLTKYPTNVGVLYWPTFIVAGAASIIASQAMISGTFAIISQSQTLGCCPRVKVYIPEINFVLAVACVVVTVVFRSTEKISNAYGIALVFVMLITTFMVALIMLITSIWWITLFVIAFGGVELVYLSSVLYKFVQGGYLPLAFAFILMMMMGIWHYVHVKKYRFKLCNIVSRDYMRELAPKQTLQRIPGIRLLYSELVQGVPPIFSHFIEKIPSIHWVVVLVLIKQLPIPRVEIAERYLFRQVEQKDFRLYRCVVRYGYINALEEPKVFDESLIQQLKNYIDEESTLWKSEAPRQSEVQREELNDTKLRSGSSIIHIERTLEQNISSNETHSSEQISIEKSQEIEKEKQIIEKELEKGVVYLVGEANVRAKQDSSILKKIVVNYMCNFMRTNFSQGDRYLMICKTNCSKWE